MAIIVHAALASTVEGIDALREAIAVMESKSRAEAGCLDYSFSTELNDPTVIRIAERWADLDALAAHFKEPHMAEFQAAMAKHPPVDVRINFFEASEIESPLR